MNNPPGKTGVCHLIPILSSTRTTHFAPLLLNAGDAVQLLQLGHNDSYGWECRWGR